MNCSKDAQEEGEKKSHCTRVDRGKQQFEVKGRREVLLSSPGS